MAGSKCLALARVESGSGRPLLATRSCGCRAGGDEAAGCLVGEGGDSAVATLITRTRASAVRPAMAIRRESRRRRCYEAKHWPRRTCTRQAERFCQYAEAWNSWARAESPMAKRVEAAAAAARGWSGNLLRQMMPWEGQEATVRATRMVQQGPAQVAL